MKNYPHSHVEKSPEADPLWPFMAQHKAAIDEDRASEHPTLQYNPINFMLRLSDIFRHISMTTQEDRTRNRCERMEAEVLAYIDIHRQELKGK